MGPVISGMLFALAGVMLIVGLHLLPIWRFAKVQLSIFVLAAVVWGWWNGSPHADLQLVKADQGIEWRDDGAAQVTWSAEIENSGDGTRVRGHIASKLIRASEGSATVTSRQVANALDDLEDEVERQHRERHEPSDSLLLGTGARRAFSIRLEPLNVNQLSSWRAEDRPVVVYLLRLEYSDWHGFYQHVRYVCKFGKVSEQDKRPCPRLDDL